MVGHILVLENKLASFKDTNNLLFAIMGILFTQGAVALLLKKNINLNDRGK